MKTRSTRYKESPARRAAFLIASLLCIGIAFFMFVNLVSAFIVYTPDNITPYVGYSFGFAILTLLSMIFLFYYRKSGK